MKIASKFLLLLILISGILHAESMNSDESDQNEFTDAPEDFTPKIPNQTKPWQTPNYTDQKNALGWSPNVFEPVPNMQMRVNFWIDIYTKYNTSQGVLHDAYYVDFVYDQLDFQEIRADKTKTPRMQKKAIEKIIKDKRHAIQDRILKISKFSSADGLTGEDLRYWNMFTKLHDKNKFNDAADQRRIRFQLGQSDRFLQGIFYSGRYLRQMESIFREENLPIELTRLPFVESSFNIFARSKVGASGVWQFMRRTAKLYMKVNASVDERNDPLRAARSAARMLRQNYQYLGNWPLAITGWNHGPNGVKKIVKKLGTDDLSKIVSTYSSNRFGFASENFYASFLAALYVESHANLFFTGLKWSKELENEEFKLTRSMPFSTLNSFFDSDLDRTLLLNPQFQSPVRKGKTPIPAGSFVHIPKSRSIWMNKFLKENLSVSELSKQLAEVAKKEPFDRPLVVAKADAPMDAKTSSISEKSPTAEIPNGAAAVAPVPNSPPIPAASPVAIQAASPTPTASASPIVGLSDGQVIASEKIETPLLEYRVRRGDSLTRIAKRLHYKLTKLIEANPEVAEIKLMPGMKIKLPPTQN